MNQLRPSIGKIVIGGMFFVILFDAVGSIAAKTFGFQYALLIPGSLLIYGIVAAMVARRGDWVLGLVAATALALTDVMVGWAVAGRGHRPGPHGCDGRLGCLMADRSGKA